MLAELNGEAFRILDSLLQKRWIIELYNETSQISYSKFFHTANPVQVSRCAQQSAQVVYVSAGLPSVTGRPSMLARENHTGCTVSSSPCKLAPVLSKLHKPVFLAA